jgi:hypothetical protein
MPRASISIPMEAALIPFPMLESTPPVTKMNFFCFAMRSPLFGLESCIGFQVFPQ